MCHVIIIQTYARACQEERLSHTLLAVTVGETVRKQREKLGWTKAELARRVGTDPSTISRLESNDRLPGPDIAESLERVLQLKSGLISKAVIAEKKKRRTLWRKVRELMSGKEDAAVGASPSEIAANAVAAASQTKQFLKESYPEELPLFEFFWDSTRQLLTTVSPGRLSALNPEGLAGALGFSRNAQRQSISFQVFLSIYSVLDSRGNIKNGVEEDLEDVVERFVASPILLRQLVEFLSRAEYQLSSRSFE